MHTINVKRKPQRKPPITTNEPLTYCLVVHPVTFQDDDPTFSLTASSVGGDGPSSSSRAGSAQATTELTKNATDDPKYVTPTALEGGNRISNLTLPTGLEDQELPADTDSDVMSAGSFGANDDNSTYLKSSKNSPAIENITSDLSDLIKETGNIHKVFIELFEELNTPRVLFNQDDKINPTYIVEGEAAQTKTPLENGGTLPLLNQLISKSSPPIDVHDAPY